jgi:AraC-like DNA-binding protein
MNINDIVFVYHLKDERQIAWHGRIHQHKENEYELHYFISGAGSFRNGLERAAINSGELYLSRPFVDHQIIATDPKRPITYYALLFSLDLKETGLAELLRERLFTRRSAEKIGNGWRFFFAELREKALSADPDLQVSARYQFLAFLYGLSARNSLSYAGTQDSVHIEKVISYMQNHIKSKLTLGDLSSFVGVSREHLTRLFTARMQMPPMKYLTKLKLEAAAAMLSSTDYRIGEIADELGFENQFHFARLFARQTGLSPSKYRSQYFQKEDFTS